MEGVIELFDVDIVDQMEPLHTFGKKPKKKKSKKSSKVCFQEIQSYEYVCLFYIENK
jgi:hypothetical protein